MSKGNCCGGNCGNESGTEDRSSEIPKLGTGNEVGGFEETSPAEGSWVENVEGFRADTDRMGLLFSVLQREEDASRTSGYIYKIAKSEMDKLISEI